MWRWPVVQARKDAVNSVKWKIFSLHAKLIAVAASKWWNPDDNPALFAAIHKAKKEWVPNDNIERAIKKGTEKINLLPLSKRLFMSDMHQVELLLWLQL